jgi:hypothetical protein
MARVTRNGGRVGAIEWSPRSTEPIRSDRHKWPSASVQKNKTFKNGPRRAEPPGSSEASRAARSALMSVARQRLDRTLSDSPTRAREG